MKKILLILTTFLLAASVNAQLCGPSKTKTKQATVEYSAVCIAIDLSGGIKTLVEGEFVTDSVIIPQMVFTYPSFTTCDEMIESIRVKVHHYRAGRSSLVGSTPAQETDSIYTVTFVPIDKNMTHFRGAIDVSTLNWDKVEVTAMPGSAKIIKKADYKPVLIRREKKKP
ncbi:MAG: hypothetical protein ACI4V2_05395 [Alloprevotella sp.]